MRTRTGYSFKTAVGHLPDVMTRLSDIGAKVAPISDRCSTFAFTRWTKLALAAGLKPIYGVELACVPEYGTKRPPIDYWTFFAQDSLEPLHSLIWKATNSPEREPSLTYKMALSAKGVFIIAGERLLIDRLPKLVNKQFFVGLSPSTPKGLVNRAQKRKMKFLAVSDNVYPAKDDLEFYRVALGRRSGTQTYPRHILSDGEWRSATQFVADRQLQDSALKNRNVVIKKCNATMKQAKLLVPKKPVTLRHLCLLGAKDKGTDLKNKIYKTRLDRELKLIKEKEYEDYFFILADMVQWAKKRMIVGPARGSSCGSLVCYLLDITSIDPIPFGLIFERFIDLNRTDLPDIDVDFSDANRHLVFEYVEEKYGRDHVARLGTVHMFQPRSVLKIAGPALRIPMWRTNKILDSLIERSPGDVRANLALLDTLETTEAGCSLLSEHPELIIASRMEGHPSLASQHAAGVVITDKPVTDYVAVDARTKATWCDKKDSETLNLLKIDALGLTQLSIFERCLELIGEEPVSGWLEKIPLDDPAAFDVLNSRHYAGIFQFMGTALKSLANQITFDSLEDMVAMTALARPGPLATGGAHSWVRRKNGREAITTVHSMMTKLTKDTFGVVVYQEQTMRIVREIGKFSWADTSTIRKAMSRSLGDEFLDQYRVRFLEGAAQNNINEEIAIEIWDQIKVMGSYAFNRSHAVAYGMVSYWCCWLKAHHPIEFAAATLDSEKDPGKQITMLRELKDEGVDYVPIDPEHSTDRWTLAEKDGKQLLIGPLTAVKGIGPASVREILDARKEGKPIRQTLAKRLALAKTEIDTLFPVADAIKRLHPDLSQINIFSEPLPVIDAQCGVAGDVMIFVLMKKVAPLDENEAQRVLKRGHEVKGPTAAIQGFCMDDTDEIFWKINRFKFEAIGRKVMETAKAGKSLYAIKGTVPRGFRMIDVKLIRYLGEIG